MTINQNTYTDKTHTILQSAALWYARHGYAVFPLIPGDKKPLRDSNGVDDATTDERQIRAWWSENPHYNIGIAAGASGLLILDPDTYKTGIDAADLVAPEELRTVLTLTPNGGQHIWYRQPEGARLGNGTGDLPRGVDVRGYGGYVVAPPSILATDEGRKPYRFAPGHKPTDLEPRPLPAHIQKRLANTQRPAQAVAFGPGVGSVDLAQWRLPADVVELIHHPPPKGARSEADYKVILALVDAGATDDELRAVFVGYPIGTAGKYAERGRGGDQYLAHSIGKARSAKKARGDLVGKLHKARAWLRSAAGIAYLKTAGIRRPTDYLKTADAVLEIAIVRGAPNVLPGLRPLAEAAGVSHQTARNHLARLAELRPGGAALWRLTLDRATGGIRIELAPILELCATLTVDTLSQNVGGVKVMKSLQPPDFYAENRAGDPWRSGIYAHAVKRRQLAPLAPSLGSAALLVWPILEAATAALTVYEVADRTGLSPGAARRALRRLEDAALLVVWSGRPYRYELHPNAEERLEERTPHMLTYGLGALHAWRHANSRAAWSHWELRKRISRPPKERAKLAARQDRGDAHAAAWGETLDAIGLNPKVKVKPPKLRTLHYDPASEWELHKPIWEAWKDLAPTPPPERHRLLAFVGYTHSEIDTAIRMAQRIGKAEREFVIPPGTAEYELREATFS